MCETEYTRDSYPVIGDMRVLGDKTLSKNENELAESASRVVAGTLRCGLLGYILNR